MAAKENKGGILNNEQIEQDLKAKGKAGEGTEGYIGSQDTGDKSVRQPGTEVQQADGRPMDNEENGE